MLNNWQIHLLKKGCNYGERNSFYTQNIFFSYFLVVKSLESFNHAFGDIC